MNGNEILRQALDVYKDTVASLSAARAEEQERHRKEVESLNARIMELTAQVAWLKRQLFGSKTEKLPVYDPSCPDLFADQFADRAVDGDCLLQSGERTRCGHNASRERN